MFFFQRWEEDDNSNVFVYYHFTNNNFIYWRHLNQGQVEKKTVNVQCIFYHSQGNQKQVYLKYNFYLSRFQ